MNKRLKMLFASQLLAASTALAQSQFSGKVVSADDGEPVIGATVRVAGTDAAVVTDIDGISPLPFRQAARNSRFRTSVWTTRLCTFRVTT